MLDSKEELQRIVHELSVHQIELEVQSEELQYSRDQFEEALAQYTDLYEFAPLGYLTPRHSYVPALTLLCCSSS